MTSDLELLAIEVDTLWTRDERGRLLRAGGLNPAAAPHFVLGVAREGQVAAVGRKVPDGLAAELLTGTAACRLPAGGEPPEELDAWCAALGAVLEPVAVSNGPSYVAGVGPTVEEGTALITCDGVTPCRVPLEPPPDSGWEPGEWRALLAGELGPWAMSIVGEHIAAICFSSRLTAAAAEAGLRTEPEFRRQGHGAAATAAWARLVIESGRVAFYSTSADNVASQRVAASLGLRPIGWRWQIGPRPRV